MIPLVRDGKVEVCIVLSENPAPVERHAAEELQRYFQ